MREPRMRGERGLARHPHAQFRGDLLFHRGDRLCPRDDIPGDRLRNRNDAVGIADHEVVGPNLNRFRCLTGDADRRVRSGERPAPRRNKRRRVTTERWQRNVDNLADVARAAVDDDAGAALCPHREAHQPPDRGARRVAVGGNDHDHAFGRAAVHCERRKRVDIARVAIDRHAGEADGGTGAFHLRRQRADRRCQPLPRIAGAVEHVAHHRARQASQTRGENFQFGFHESPFGSVSTIDQRRAESSKARGKRRAPASAQNRRPLGRILGGIAMSGVGRTARYAWARVVAFAIASFLTVAVAPARAEQIVVSNYGVSPNGMPYAIAMERGFFKEYGVNVDGILTSDGGGSTIRNLLGGKLAYGEAAPAAVVAAVQGGADLRIISGNVHTVAEFVWVTMPNSPIASINDLKS